MYLILSLLAAAIITLLAVSKIVKMLHAKRFDFGWVAFASIASGAVAIMAFFTLGLFVEGLDPMIMLGLTLTVMFVVSSAVFKYANQMNWGGAITSNIANIVIGVAGITIALVLNGESISKTIESITSGAKKNTAMMSSVVNGEDMNRISQEAFENAEKDIPAEELEESLEPMITELDLLPKGTIKAIEKKKKHVYIEPKYHIVNIGNIHSLVGRPIKIHKQSNKIIEGTLKSINGSDAIVMQRIASGIATTPISLTTIRKLEVYR